MQNLPPYQSPNDSCLFTSQELAELRERATKNAARFPVTHIAHGAYMDFARVAALLASLC